MMLVVAGEKVVIAVFLAEETYSIAMGVSNVVFWHWSPVILE